MTKLFIYLSMLVFLSSCVLHESEARKEIKANGTGYTRTTIIMAAHKHCYVVENIEDYIKKIAPKVKLLPMPEQLDIGFLESKSSHEAYTWHYYSFDQEVAKECRFKSAKNSDLDLANDSKIAKIIEYFREI